MLNSWVFGRISRWLVFNSFSNVGKFRSDSLAHLIQSMNLWYRVFICGCCRHSALYIWWYAIGSTQIILMKKSDWLCAWFHLQIGYDYNLAELTVTSIVCLWSIVLTFAQCEIGNELSKQFHTIGSELEQCEWYLFSIDAKQMLAIVLLNAQQPVIIRGFANTKFTRDSFKKVDQINTKWVFFYCNLQSCSMLNQNIFFTIGIERWLLYVSIVSQN